MATDSIIERGKPTPVLSIACRFRRFPAGTAQGASRGNSGELAAFIFQAAVYEYILHAAGKLRGLGVGGVVDDRCRIEYRNVGEVASLQQAAADQAFALRGQRRHFADSLLEWQEMLIANVAAKEVWHGAEGPRVRVWFVKRAVERELAGIEAQAGPRLLQAVHIVLFAGHEIERPSLSFVGDDEIEECVEFRLFLGRGDFSDCFPVE